MQELWTDLLMLPNPVSFKLNLITNVFMLDIVRIILDVIYLMYIFYV